MLLCVCVCTSQKQHSGSPDQHPLPQRVLHLHMKHKLRLYTQALSHILYCVEEQRDPSHHRVSGTQHACVCTETVCMCVCEIYSAL